MTSLIFAGAACFYPEKRLFQAAGRRVILHERRILAFLAFLQAQPVLLDDLSQVGVPGGDDGLLKHAGLIEPVGQGGGYLQGIVPVDGVDHVDALPRGPGSPEQAGD